MAQWTGRTVTYGGVPSPVDRAHESIRAETSCVVSCPSCGTEIARGRPPGRVKDTADRGLRSCALWSLETVVISQYRQYQQMCR
eukprot:9467092-Pyramimonas_sp.AAC.1